MPRLPFRMSCYAAGFLIAATNLLWSPSPALASAGCSSDVSGNHVTDVADVLGVINSWGPCPAPPLPCDADVNGSGAVNVTDLLTVLSGWGSCPCSSQFGCLSAIGVWCEDFELGNYARWTDGYAPGNSCETTGFAANTFVSPTHSHKSTVICTTPESHRGYGGLRFQGDVLIPSFAIPSTGGIDAPNGVIVTFWSWISVPYTFTPTKWLSLMTVTNDCSNTWADVITLNLDDSTMRIKPVHVSTVTYVPNAPSMPLQQWVRTTVYLNYYAGVMHVWQNGTKVVSATFSRPVDTMCQWHWGLYASGNNDNITLYEENISIVKLQQPLTNFALEPWVAPGTVACTSAQ